MPNKQFVVPQASSPGSGGGGGGSGTVTSVGLADSTGLFTVTGSPVTTSGTLTLSAFANQSANRVLAGPTSGGASAASFRALVTADLPAGVGTVTSVTFTGDGTVLSSTPSSAVTTSGTLTAALANAGGGTILGNNTTSSAAPAYTTAPVLGIPGTSTGSIALASSTASGKYTITAPANAATPTLTLPTGTGTFAVTASAPIVLDATTGALTAPTAVTSASSLTSNAIVLGAGSQGTKVVTGLTTDGTAGINVGATGVGGTVTIFGASSGSNTLTAPGNGTQLSLSATTVAYAGAGTLTSTGAALTLTGGTAITLKPNGSAVVSYVGVDNLPTNSFTATAAGTQINLQNRGTFAPTSGATNFTGVISNPTINQTGGANGTIRILASYPVNTALVGTEYLIAAGTSSATGPTGTLTDLYLVDSTGNVTQQTTNGAQWISGQISEQITLNTGGTTTDSAANLLPANSIIEGVAARITTTITTAANWSLGDGTTAARFMAANSTLTSGTTAVGLQAMQGSVSTDAAGPVQTAAAKLRITTNANPGAGVIRITVFYRQFVGPTS